MLFAVLSAVLGLGVSADEAAEEPTYKWSYVQEAVSPVVEGKTVYLPDPEFSQRWLVPADGVRVSRQVIDDTPVLQLNLRDSFSENQVKITYDEPCTLAGYDVVSVLLNIGGVETEGPSYYRVSVEISLSGGEKAFSEAWVSPNGWQELVMDISDAEEMEAFTVTVFCDGVPLPKMLRIASLHLDYSERYDHIERYSTHFFEVSGGRLGGAGDRIVLHPYGGTADLEGDFVLREIPQDRTQAFMLVTLSGQISGGSVTMGYRTAYHGSVSYADSGALALQNGTYVYSFPFIVSEDMISYCLSFRNVALSGSGITVESVSVIFTEDIPLQTTGAGFVSGISLNGENGRLTIEGSVSQAVVSSYKKDELVVYAVPFTSSPRLEGDHVLWEGTEILRSKLYMNFELVLDAELTSRYAGTHMFYAAVEGEEHDPILLSHPRGVDHAVHRVEDNSIVGIEGASAVGVFESNASHVIVDMPFDRLVLQVIKPEMLEDGQGGRAVLDDAVKLVAADGTMILLDKAFLDELLAEIGFYSSANLEVYLRVTDADTVFVNNIGRLTAWDMEIYSAILSAVFSMESQLMKEAVSGVILGEAVTYTKEQFHDISAYDYASRLNTLMQVTYSTMNLYLDPSGICVIVPFLEKGDYNAVVSQMIAFHNERTGGIPWYLMFAFSHSGEGDGFVSVRSEAESLMESSRTFGSAGQAIGHLFFYIPDVENSADEITLAYNSFCEYVRNPRAVFLSVRALVDDRKEQLYRLLKNIRKEEKNSVIETITAEYMEDGAEDIPSYTVWDFSNLYHNDGWVSGGAVSGCGTGRSEIFSQFGGISRRALRTKVYSNFENSMASAIILRNFSYAIDLNGADDLVFRFSVAETEELSTLIFVLGNERIRAEYTLTDVLPGMVHTVRCPVAEFSGKDRVAYIGVMVYSGESAVLEIESVKVQSGSLSHDEMAALFAPPTAALAEKSFAGFYIAGILGVITVFLAVMLIRRDREDVEQKNEQQSVKMKYGRGYYGRK